MPNSLKYVVPAKIKKKQKLELQVTNTCREVFSSRSYIQGKENAIYVYQ